MRGEHKICEFQIQFSLSLLLRCLDSRWPAFVFSQPSPSLSLSLVERISFLPFSYNIHSHITFFMARLCTNSTQTGTNRTEKKAGCREYRFQWNELQMPQNGTWTTNMKRQTLFPCKTIYFSLSIQSSRAVISIVVCFVLGSERFLSYPTHPAPPDKYSSFACAFYLHELRQQICVRGNGG